jgi:hypothetical protein
MRPRHPDKHIEEAVQYAESLGWRVTVPGGHAWGHIWCPETSRDGCRFPIYSTPRVPEYHARNIRKYVAQCRHGRGS